MFEHAKTANPPAALTVKLFLALIGGKGHELDENNKNRQYFTKPST